MPEDTYDYIIVGAGTAGCLLANRLSADPGARVLLLEAGGKDNYHWIHIPVGYLYLMGNPRTDWGFKTAAEPGLNGRSLDYPRGRVLGGCSSINGMIYMRGQARDYDQWRQMGNPGWAWDDVLPYFKKHRGPVGARARRLRRAARRAAASGASSSRASAGRSSTPSATPRPRPAFPRSTISTAATTRAAATSTSTRRRGVRWNTSKALPAARAAPAEPRRSRPHAHGRAAGARRQARARASSCARTAASARLRARREVSWRPAPSARPQILQLSGIGAGRAAAAASASPCGTSCRASARTCRTTCRSAAPTRSQGVTTMNERCQSLVQRAGFAARVRAVRGAGR